MEEVKERGRGERKENGVGQIEGRGGRNKGGRHNKGSGGGSGLRRRHEKTALTRTEVKKRKWTNVRAERRPF